ncbi:Asp-tRNA(Asn)/Glu-tRNA(Gln) amidotransferase subunit GatA [Methylophilaceae bacterium]|jgi:aspartyl-tRNA(Asn)/glutamyl-tRNA(Gln) amidotransferase subunit A|nr:Asp-tRNA(Asn)/Glu-tRNA(Gln) amidotransferase subunit GatA [Methylophilaceae bacterium]MDA7760731.1 Asp-tRNA(Asn)/Glu-tRNA(Gln) amidotransferase subunit GatA [Methylophilaceae bacterium]MDA7835077.1 Asp-tRNA(Asn)/Glu-tRNA(Gln) amidotransferase subunit GatA [Methylophilaceae bacterium]|tara:strand:+ start:1854 stop:3308 length:1455 start_codon:yes stop_codon:yes gene_type:complete
MINLSLKELSEGLKQKKFSSVELTQFFLNRLDLHNSSINAFITIDKDKSLAMAKHSDEIIKEGNQDYLTGIPIAQKDIFCAEGWKTSCGSKMLDNFIAPYDSTVISKFNAVGAVNLGKTNMDEFAMGSSNETSFYGNVKNPWDIKTVPGGSSGGSAAAVAGRLAPAATATDTGGSIRQPASLCGLTGLKPTYGLVSRYGMIAFASSLDQAGPMCHTAEDCAAMMNVMSGHDPKDSTSIQRAKENYLTGISDPIKGLKIGVPKEFFSEGLDPEVEKIIERGINEYKKLGAEIVEISLPNNHLSIPVYYVIAPAEASSNLSRYDGVRYGYRTKEYDDLMEMYCKTREEGFGEEVKRRIMIGTYVLSAGYYDAYYLKAQKIRRLISEDFKKAFENCDVILGPSAPSVAFPIGEKKEDPLKMYMQDVYTISTNLAGLPGLSMPAGLMNELPVGIQLIGNYFSEAKLLNIANIFQMNTDWHNLSPEEFK